MQKMMFKKRVSEGTTLVGHTQVTRFFTNSSTNALEVGKLLSLNVSQVKGMADRALAFCNTRSIKESAGRSKVFNINAVPPVLSKRVHKSTSFQSHKNGGSEVFDDKSRNSTSTGKGGDVYHCLPTIVKKPATSDQAFSIPCANHFQLHMY